MLLAAGVALLPPVLAAPSTAQAALSAGWPSPMFDDSHSSVNPEALSITPTNASSLVRRWTWTPPVVPGRPQPLLIASPVTWNGLVFIGTDSGYFYALRETTGKVAWKRDLGYQPRTSCAAKGTRASAVVADDPATGLPTVYVPSGDGDMYALDAASGTPRWTSQIPPPGASLSQYYDWGAPTISGGNIYVGMSWNCQSGGQGGVVRMDQSSGARLATYVTNPLGAGGSVWSSPVVAGGSVWVTTGDAIGQAVAGDANSIVRLDASTLARQDIWTVPDVSALDLDFGGSPTLFVTGAGNAATATVGACDKNGSFYAFKASAMAPGPTWQDLLGAPAQNDDMCLAAADWDAARGLVTVASNTTTIASMTYPGSLRSVDPATGAYRWQLGLGDGPVMSTPSVDGAGVLAADTYDLVPGHANALYLVNEETGTLLSSVPLDAPAGSQPIFSDKYLLVADTAELTALAP